jgi:Ras-related protein Rab-5C
LETKREVLTSEAKAYAQENGCIFFETSAKNGDNVHAIFKAIGKIVVAFRRWMQ